MTGLWLRFPDGHFYSVPVLSERCIMKLKLTEPDETEPAGFPVAAGNELMPLGKNKGSDSKVPFREVMY